MFIFEPFFSTLFQGGLTFQRLNRYKIREPQYMVFDTFFSFDFLIQLYNPVAVVQGDFSYSS